MDKPICRTTKEHYEKFRNMASNAGLSFNNGSNIFYMGYTKKELLTIYNNDPLLNFISLIKFDGMYFGLTRQAKKYITNLADNCCVYKHLLICEVLEATPIFEGNEK